MDFGKGISSLLGIIKVLLAVITLLLVLFVAVIFYPEFFPEKVIDGPWKPKSVLTDLKGEPKASLIKLGHEIITETPLLIGQLSKSQRKRFSGNNLTCQNCHLEAGTKPGAGSFVGVFNRFPQFRGRENGIGTLEQRVNGCMERSMDGVPLPENSLEMKAIIAYMKWLSDDIPEEELSKYKGYVAVNLPQEAAKPLLGKVTYEKHCTVCHGENGQGQRPNDKGLYVYPPLWGKDTYNHGAGMHRVITAAQFIKGNMPYLEATWDNPVLTDEEAYHVAAYINSFDRPQKSNPENDFPDKQLKPVSTPYGPWTDNFSAEQHKYGPFQPMMVFYEERYGIKKSK
jgi:thiosulfate dehydrogenase